MKATSTTKSETKQPKSVAVRELIPWAIVLFLTTAIIGVISGWTLRTVAANQARNDIAAVAVSKPQQ